MQPDFTQVLLPSPITTNIETSTFESTPTPHRMRHQPELSNKQALWKQKTEVCTYQLPEAYTTYSNTATLHIPISIHARPTTRNITDRGNQGR
jgi:hypothetical protein